MVKNTSLKFIVDNIIVILSIKNNGIGFPEEDK